MSLLSTHDIVLLLAGLVLIGSVSIALALLYSDSLTEWIRKRLYF